MSASRCPWRCAHVEKARVAEARRAIVARDFLSRTACASHARKLGRVNSAKVGTRVARSYKSLR